MESEKGNAGGARFGARQKFGLALGPVLFLAAAYGLACAGVGPSPRWAGATVALMAAWWITEPIPLWATACIPLLTLPLLCGLPLGPVLLQYADPINFLMIGGMFIAAAMQEWGLHRRIALAIVSAIGASPRRLVLGFMLATGFISLWISNTAAAMMMFPIGMAVLLKFEEQHGAFDPLLRRFGTALMLGIAYAASIGGIGTKIGTGTNLVFIKQAGIANVLPRDVDFVTWLKIGLPVVIVAIPAVWFYLVRFAARLPAEGFPGAGEAITEARRRQGPILRGEQIALAAFLSAALLWIFRKDIELGAFTIPGWSSVLKIGWADLIGPLPPKNTALGKWLSGDNWGDAAVACVIGLPLLLIPVQRRPLRFALSLGAARRGGWGVVLLLGGGFAMAHGIQASGLSEWAGSLLRGRELGAFPAMLLVCLITVVLTEVASNTATASIILPLIPSFAASLGLNPVPLMFGATLAASFGFMLPAGTPPNAIVFSSGYITVPQMARSGILVDLFGVVLVSVMCYFLVPWAMGT